MFKIGLILAFIIGGFLMGDGSVVHFTGDLDLGSIVDGKFAVSLIFVSFAYSGWNAAAYLGGEIKKPSRNLPLALLGGTLIVMALYMGLNAVFIYALSPEKMSGVLEVGTHSAVSLFGKGVSKYFSGAIALGLLSVLSAMIMAGPRVYYAMAKDGVFFELFGKVNKLHKTPARAIFLQAFIAICMAITASFDELLIYIGFTLALCAVLTVCGMVKLRMTRFGTRDSRQYSTPGYPVTPLLFILGNLWIVYFSIRSRPAASLCGLLTIGIGILIFFYFNKRMKGPREA
jgi:APA family basic amino acid/polyamine antiporter